MARESEYILGAAPEELDRLRHQHEVWRPVSESVFDEVAIQPGWCVLDAGCGPGLVLSDLVRRIGSQGEAWGVDMTPAMLQEAESLAQREEWPNYVLKEGNLSNVELPQEKFDFIWMRWVLTFPDNPENIVARLTESLKPGGIFAIQDYNHDGVGLFPRSEGFQAVVRATREFYTASGGDPWVAARLPQFFENAGLRVDSYRTHVLSGNPGEPAFQWAARFFPMWAKAYHEQGFLSDDEYRCFQTDWAARLKNPHARYFSPIMVTSVAQKKQ